MRPSGGNLRRPTPARRTGRRGTILPTIPLVSTRRVRALRTHEVGAEVLSGPEEPEDPEAGHEAHLPNVLG